MDDQQTTIIIIAVSVIVIVLLHVLLHNFIKFKIDEATILNVFQIEEKDVPETARTTFALSTYTGLSSDRISAVCRRSAKLRRNSMDVESWRLRKTGQQETSEATEKTD
jgi:hypothetical protein